MCRPVKSFKVDAVRLFDLWDTALSMLRVFHG